MRITFVLFLAIIPCLPRTSLSRHPYITSTKFHLFCMRMPKLRVAL